MTQSDWVFPPPYLPSEMYRAEVMTKPEEYEGKWPRVRVSVQRNIGPQHYEPDPDNPWDSGIATSDSWEEIAQYDRNYSMLRTFHPFRQLRDGVWRDYALISPRYTSFAVMDLQTGEVVAEQSPSERDLARAQKIVDEYTAEGATSEWSRKFIGATPEEACGMLEGFCPVEFWVPDFFEPGDDSWDERESQGVSFEDQIEKLKVEHAKFIALNGEKPSPDNKDSWTWWSEEEERRRGNFALYAGCVWGDDSSWKIQYIDLSRLHEGIVTSDNRLGYIELHRNQNLKDAVSYNDEMDRFEIAINMHFNRETGEAGWWYMNQDPFVTFADVPEWYKNRS